MSVEKSKGKSKRVRYISKVENKEITVYWHPEHKVWTPNHGVEITFEVLGTYARRNGEQSWHTDAVYSQEIPQGMSPKEIKSLRDSLRHVLSLDEEADYVSVIETDVINLDMV
jgi:hypothetical protein